MFSGYGFDDFPSILKRTAVVARTYQSLFVIKNEHCYEFYLLFQGFRILVDREWLQFGHKFGDRCGLSSNSCSPEEQSPIFLQWLDCVRQIQRQFPNCFEFNELFLVRSGNPTLNFACL